MTETGGKRLDGWKAIAGYFGRDRSTVMRWARERQLPVHRLPGGKQGTVFAFADELAAWTRNHPDEEDAPASAPARAAAVGTGGPGRLIVALCLVVAALSLGIGWWSWSMRGTVRPQLSLPRDHAVAALYLEARDTWARRTGPDIARSIDLYRAVIRRDPNFAPAHAGLADAWLTYREYGAVDENAAFGAARDAAQRAIKLDPDLPAAHRALGFIAYWWSNDAPAAIAQFERAVALDPDDAQTHFWYANFLAYIGKDAAAERHYTRARLLTPGVQAIEVEYGCAQWLAGHDRRAATLLPALARRYPNDPTLRQCLAWERLGHGDIAGFVAEKVAIARLRGSADAQRDAAALQAALAQSPAAAADRIIAVLERELADGTRRQHETSSFYASALGRRDVLVRWLRQAVAGGERWDAASITRRIATRWRGDREIEALLKKVRAPIPTEPA
jgi:tetratricopeptide (TPR) repeat protein